MRDEEILQIVLDWNFWEKEQGIGVERSNYVNLIYPFLKTNQAIVITGVRRSGKSTIMLQLAKKLIDSGSDPKDILIINFEDYRFYGVSLKLLHKIYELYLKKIAGKTRIIILDEVHKVTGWEKFVRTLLDKKEAKIIVSGSNAKLITEEYATLLTGRNIKFLVFPLSFREFLSFKGLKPEEELKILAERIKIKKLLDEFLRYGGFPEVVLADEVTKRKISIDYIDGIITKDVVDRYKIREKAKLGALARYYLSNISNKISFNKLKEYLGIPLRTVERFSYYLEEAYVISFLKRFSFKVKEQEKAARKVYSVDIGLCNAMGFRFSQDYGKIMENVVFLELMKTNANNPNFEIYYWQDTAGKEVDFVIKQGLEVKQLIQVSYDIDDIDVKKRELKALTKASEELKCRNLIVITWDYESEENVDNNKIRFVPLWKWLLATRN